MKNENTKILFPDSNDLIINKLDKKYSKQVISKNDLTINNVNSSLKITTKFIDYIDFLIVNNLLPDLPSELKIIYTRDNSFFTLDKNKQNINSISIAPPEDYSYPACMVPSTNTLYLSNDLELNSNTISNLWNKTLSKINPSATNAVLNYRNIFNQDNQKALEYIVGHELGHFFLQLKNKDKPLLTKNPIVSQCALNIEESLSEIFKAHIMCLKHHLNENSNDFPKLKDYRINNEKHRLRYLKNNPTEKDITEYQEYFKQKGIDKLLSSYDFPLVYQNIPLRNNNGQLETDIDKIYEKSYQLALTNNKQAINNLLNIEKFNQYGLTTLFQKELEKSQKLIAKNINQVIDAMHQQLGGMSFYSAKILGIRSYYSNNDISTKNKKKF